MRFVAIRSVEQMDMQAIHRVREQLIGERTATINQMRAFLLEYGIAVPVGGANLMKCLPLILEDAENGLSCVMRALLNQMQMRLRQIQKEVDTLTGQIKAITKWRNGRTAWWQSTSARRRKASASTTATTHASGVRSSGRTARSERYHGLLCRLRDALRREVDSGDCFLPLRSCDAR